MGGPLDCPQPFEALTDKQVAVLHEALNTNKAAHE
jgi:hypothetical protein